MNLSRRSYIALTIGVLLLASFILSESFRLTIKRRHQIADARKQAHTVQRQITALKTEISHLQKDPASYESLVRRELGYLRPGEMEVRIQRN